VMRAKLPALPIEGNDTSGAIRAAFTTMPREDQAELLAKLQPKTVRLRWLEPQDAAKVIAILPDLPTEAQALVENRLLPPWMRRIRRQSERDDAIRDTAPLYAEHRTGRAIAEAIAAHCRRLPPSHDPRREAIERILAANCGQAPGFTTVRNALASLTRDPGQKTAIALGRA
jgi:hypothetical protein